MDCATFPPGIESHSAVQDFYFGAITCCDGTSITCTWRVASPPPQYVYAMIEADGILLPPKRIMYQRGLITGRC